MSALVELGEQGSVIDWRAGLGLRLASHPRQPPVFQLVEQVEDFSRDDGGDPLAVAGDRGRDTGMLSAEGMEDQLGALGLVLNCITLWNTVYLDAALARLRDEGYPVRDEDVVRLSAYMRRHLNVHGHYSFQLPDLVGARRALRDPDASDDDEDR